MFELPADQESYAKRHSVERQSSSSNRELEGYSKARDVFIAGLPNFNTTEAYEKVAYHKARLSGAVGTNLRVAVSGFRCSDQIVSALQTLGSAALGTVSA